MVILVAEESALSTFAGSTDTSNSSGGEGDICDAIYRLTLEE
jgi:hypothetical protein